MSVDTLPVHAESSADDLTVVALDPSERATVLELARELGTRESGCVDDAAWLRAATLASNRLPLVLRDALRLYRRDPGPTGVLLVRGLPDFADELPPTPTVMDSVQRAATGPASVIALLMLQMGELTAFRAEKAGALVQDVVPVPHREAFQGNAGSVRLRLHVENAFHDHRPHYVALLGLRADHERRAGLVTACVREALVLLDADTRQTLAEPRFVTEAPASFGDAGEPTAHAVLPGDPDDPDIRIDFTSTSATDAGAADAIAALGHAVQAVSRTVRLGPGDLAVADNRVVLHGRTAFRPRYDGRDRWLHRVFVHLDARRTRPVRPSDGNVLL